MPHENDSHRPAAPNGTSRTKSPRLDRKLYLAIAVRPDEHARWEGVAAGFAAHDSRAIRAVWGALVTPMCEALKDEGVPDSAREEIADSALVFLCQREEPIAGGITGLVCMASTALTVEWMTWLKRAKSLRRREVLTDDFSAHSVLPPAEDGVDLAAYARWYDRAIPHLTPKQRLVMKLKFDGFSNREIAALCTELEGTVTTEEAIESRVRKAMQQIRALSERLRTHPHKAVGTPAGGGAVPREAAPRRAK